MECWAGYGPSRRPRLIPSLPSSAPSCVALCHNHKERTSAIRQQQKTRTSKYLTYAFALRVPLHFITDAPDDLLKVLLIVVEQRGGRTIHGLTRFFASFFLPGDAKVDAEERGVWAARAVGCGCGEERLLESPSGCFRRKKGKQQAQSATWLFDQPAINASWRFFVPLGFSSHSPSR